MTGLWVSLCRLAARVVGIILIAGLAIAGLAVGAESGFLYIRGEYPEATARLSAAIDQARAAGLLGADVMGAGLSFACAIHCLATPFLLAMLPFAGVAFVLSHEIELLFVVFSITLAFVCLCLGYRLHKDLRVFFLFLFSVVVLGVGFFGGGDDHHHSGVLALGALGIVFSHLVNKRLYRSRSSSLTSLEDLP